MSGSSGKGPYAAPAIPEAYGAVGDGVTDDTLALRAAIDTLKNIWLTPGKTYLTSGVLTLNTAQIVFGNGATIKRRNQITTTTATPATGGQTVFTFADASSFRVGMNVAFADAAVAQSALVATTTVSTNNPKITSIVGNVVTVTPAPNCDIAGSANVYLNFVTFGLAAGSRVHDVRINGNRSNWAWGRWESTAEFYGANADRAVISGCYANNLPGEGATLNGLYLTVRDCVFETLSGNGIHLSGATHPVVDSCTIINPNQDTNVGHAMGCVGWSNDIYDATVSNNYLYGGRAGIGEIGAGNNTDNTIIGNTIRSSTTYGLDLTGDGLRTLVAYNRIYDCPLGLNLAIGTGTGIQIDGNLFSNAPVTLASCTDVEFINNQLLGGSSLNLNALTNSRVAGNTLISTTLRYTTCTAVTIESNLIDYTSSTTIHPLATSGGSNVGVTIARNTILGGGRGIDIANGNTNLAIIGNTMRGQNANGIFISGTGGYPGCVVLDNTILTSTASAGSWYGIRSAANSVTIKGNHVSNVHSTSNAAYGIYISDKCLVDGNRVYGPYNNGTILIAATSTNSTVCNNVTDAALTDSGTTTQKVNNTVTL